MLVAYNSYCDAFKKYLVCFSFMIFFFLLVLREDVPEQHLESLSVKKKKKSLGEHFLVCVK